MVSQLLFSGTGGSCKAAAGRVVSLLAQARGRVVSQNAGNYCRAKAKISVATIRKIARRMACQAEHQSTGFDDLCSVIDIDQAEQRLSPRVLAQIRSL